MFTQEQIHKTLAKAEEVLNLVGYIPLVSLLSAAVRTLGGKLQLLLGLVFAIGCFMAGITTPLRKKKHFQNARWSIGHALHGVLNILRALIESVPFLSLITCLPYDRVFKIRIRYSLENCIPETLVI
jgi:glycosyltransferase A (GT-A) superfamily protein (DUF2064 family)